MNKTGKNPAFPNFFQSIGGIKETIVTRCKKCCGRRNIFPEGHPREYWGGDTYFETPKTRASGKGHAIDFHGICVGRINIFLEEIEPQSHYFHGVVLFPLIRSSFFLIVKVIESIFEVSLSF